MRSTGREVKLYDMRTLFSDDLHEGSVTICKSVQRDLRFQDPVQTFKSNN